MAMLSGIVGQSAGQAGLADAGRADNEYILSFSKPLTGRQQHDQGFVHAPFHR